MENKKSSNNILDNFFKQDNNQPARPSPSSEKLEKSKQSLREICEYLKSSADVYDPVQSVDQLNQYLSSFSKIDRILYSEISSFMFSLNERERASLTTNADRLLQYVLDEEKNISEACTKIVIKLYDHAQLVAYQIENAQDIFASGIEAEKVRLEKEIKGIEKEYITILGIFASIVLAFVGNFIFSSSVLQNISQASIYRLLLAIDLLGFIFTTIILMLIRFILRINNCRECAVRFWHIVVVCAIIALLILLCWVFQLHQLPEWVNTQVPWGKS